MILLCGIPSEQPLALLSAELVKRGVQFLFLNQRRMQTLTGVLDADKSGVCGWFEIEGRAYSLADFGGIYSRLIDDIYLPEYSSFAATALPLIAAAARQDWFTRWWNLTSARVANRPTAMLSNCSKPWQLQLIRQQGFSIPATLITSDPAHVRSFKTKFGRVIYKSISSIRSIVRELKPEDEKKLDRIRWCPTQFQEYIPGRNIRVHVIGRQCLATEVLSDAVDYRYAASETGTAAELRPLELRPELAEKCVALARKLGLAFAGVDLKVTPEGRTVCFEVNPSPGYSYYQNCSGQPIAAALADYLAGGGDESS